MWQEFPGMGGRGCRRGGVGSGMLHSSTSGWWIHGLITNGGYPVKGATGQCRLAHNGNRKDKAHPEWLRKSIPSTPVRPHAVTPSKSVASVMMTVSSFGRRRRHCELVGSEVCSIRGALVENACGRQRSLTYLVIKNRVCVQTGSKDLPQACVGGTAAASKK